MLDRSRGILSVKNVILKSLPEAEFKLFLPHLEEIDLSVGDMLYQAGDAVHHIYFPNNGMISLLAVTEQGENVEVGFTGFEGLIGLPLLLGQNEMAYQTLVQSDVNAFRIESKIVKKLFHQQKVFHLLTLRYLYVIMKQLSQTCVCNNFHKIEARLCRWLTVMYERSGNKNMLLTQEFLAHMLGVQRTSIGMIASSLQSAGIIKYSRGKIEILDFERLKNSACECYEVVRREKIRFVRDNKLSVMSGI